MKRILLCLAFGLAPLAAGRAQPDSSLFLPLPDDSAHQPMNMDAVYARPFLRTGGLPVSLGGYVEMNWQHQGTDGITGGHQFQFRRFTLFVSSTITRRVKFLSELEFEDGGREISVEFAAVDVEFHPLANLRGGIMVNPIGAFNQNHDGPKWDFVDRPIAMTRMLPATWSTAGAGLYGKLFSGAWMFGYEGSVTGGFDNSILSNEENKTFLPAAKENENRFIDNPSGEPLFTGKLAVRHAGLGEVGLSYMGGVFNRHSSGGLALDERRRVDVLDVDLTTSLPALGTVITGEWAWIAVEVPATYSPNYGKRQHGGFLDVVQPLFAGRILEWEAATLSVGCRLEYVDWNASTFAETGRSIADDLWSIVPAISFRPAAQTVFRINYRYQEQRDLLGNPPSRSGGLLIGISSYF